MPDDPVPANQEILIMPGVPELLVILLIVVVLFGASRLPMLGKGLGEGISNFKRGLQSGDEDAEGDPSETGSGPGSGSSS